MSNQGAGGAYEISSRMTAMIGWAATTDFAEKWVSELVSVCVSVCMIMIIFVCVW